jgi:nucleotide-binding universal stress UspA family protein
MKFVLVPIGGSDTDNPVLETALAAARLFAAHLRFLHIRSGVGEAAQHMPHMEFASGQALRSALQDLNIQSQTRSTISIEHVHDFCTRQQIELCDTPRPTQAVTASCREEEGNPLDRILFHARHSDLIVVGRRSKPNGLPTDFLDRLLLDSGRPVLIASSSGPQTLTGTIMVCWREGADAARAVTAASPILAHARRVIFTAVAENSEYTGAAMSEMVDQFAWRGIPVETQIIAPDGRPVQELLAVSARNSGADLIVSGAYGHSRISEIMFGGCTRSFIQHADRPILLMH